jgi:peroxiredoxin
MLQALLATVILGLGGPQLGSPAPDVALTTLQGKRVAVADYRGKTLVVNVWATWCPPCREETADLIATAKRLTAHGDVAFLGVDSTEAAPIVRAFVASKNVPYQQAIDDEQRFVRAYDVRAFPTTLVIGPDGLLRARFVDKIDPKTLVSLVDAARAGANGVVTSDAQRKIDALLDPAHFTLRGDAATIRAEAKRALKAIDDVDQIDGVTDDSRTEAEKNALREAVAEALAPVASGDADTVLLARLRADTAAAQERWDEAIEAYRRGLAVAPEDVDLLGGLAEAYRAKHDYGDAADVDTQIAKLAPSVDAFIELGDVAARAGRFHDASVAFDQAIGIGRAGVQARPHDAKAIRKLAAAYLYQGRMYARAGDTARARDAFANVTAWTLKLPKNDERYAMYLEEAQEATVALDTAGGARRTTLSLTPWTGPDLPGSIASTFKYRLVVAGAPGKTVALSAAGLPQRWIASFCSDRVCAPFRTSIAIPESGVKVVELQVIPYSQVHAPPTIRVLGDGANAAVRLPHG